MALRKEQWQGEPDDRPEIEAVRDLVRQNLASEENAPVDTDVEHLYVTCQTCMRDVQISRDDADPDRWRGRCACGDRVEVDDSELNSTVFPRLSPGGR